MEEKNVYVATDQLLCVIVKGMPGVSDLASARGQEGTRTNQGSCIVYITEKPARKHAKSMLRLACSG